jgi:hypothetical protein
MAFAIKNQYNMDEFENVREIIGKALMTRNSKEWNEIYLNTDACVSKI